VNTDLEIAVAALFYALENGRLSREAYYQQYAAVSERYGVLATLVRGVEIVQVTWREWLDAALESLIVL